MSLFEVTGVRYQAVLRVDHLYIREKAITCIVGESGSGKTTLLKLFNHFVDYEGLVLYRGRDIKTLDPVALRREVVLLPQVPVIFPGTVKHNLLIGLRFAGKEPVDNALLMDLMREFRLSKELDADATAISGGEKQRLALCRVMLMDPAVLLLDEPTSALDDDTETATMDVVINYIKSRGKTLVMVTHSKKLAQIYADIIIRMHNGTVTAVEEVA